MTTNEIVVDKPPPKKRGRKKIKKENTEDDESPDHVKDVKRPKRRGRKQKGGKIITTTLTENQILPQKINIKLQIMYTYVDIKNKKYANNKGKNELIDKQKELKEKKVFIEHQIKFTKSHMDDSKRRKSYISKEDLFKLFNN